MARRYSNPLKYLVFQSQSRKSALALFVEQWAALGHQWLDASKVRFDVIDGDAIEAFYRWGGDAQFPWEDVPAWKALDAKGFDLSIWHDEQLCGLCYATPRDSKVTIKIVLLEGSSDEKHPLKGLIAALALGAIDAYARVVGCSRIEIQEPRPDVVPTYKRLGFSYDEKQHLVISVEHT
ncbi:N-acetyltransferase [Pseudomonas costantinii]|uniref:N-acetyltransferase n=1 Tax=Pseudomonas costantinii TaxID=168469 RepID=UPI0015A4AF72|nr:N-acetyltransferase [Pseudomonas costantinii]NVZ72382.1 N-acetyltransferase [Pseudomonas costantinii]